MDSPRIHLNPRYALAQVRPYLNWGNKPGDKLGNSHPIITPLGPECREYMKKNQEK